MWTLWTFLGIYAGTSMLGTSIRLGWISTRGWRWIHHLLFAVLWLSLIMCAGWSFWTNVPWRWGALMIAPFLALLPRFKPGSAAHCWTAACGLALLVGVVVWAIRS